MKFLSFCKISQIFYLTYPINCHVDCGIFMESGTGHGWQVSALIDPLHNPEVKKWIDCPVALRITRREPTDTDVFPDLGSGRFRVGIISESRILP
jgi:hypothetical protein